MYRAAVLERRRAELFLALLAARAISSVIGLWPAERLCKEQQVREYSIRTCEGTNAKP